MSDDDVNCTLQERGEARRLRNKRVVAFNSRVENARPPPRAFNRHIEIGEEVVLYHWSDENLEDDNPLQDLVRRNAVLAPDARTIRCPVCPLTLANFNAFSSHVGHCVRMEGDLKVMCERCAYIFFDKSGLRKHSKSQCDKNMDTLGFLQQPDHGQKHLDDTRAKVQAQKDANKINRAEIRRVAIKQVSEFRSNQ